MTSTILLSVFIVLLSVLSCLFSGNEITITSIKPYQWMASPLAAKHKKRTSWVLKILDNYSISLGSILICNTICNVVCSSLTTVLVEKQFGNMYVAIATGILALFILLFCEYIPKSVAKNHPIAWMGKFYWLIIFFYYLFWPICWSFNYMFDKEKNITASEKDIDFLVRTIQREGVLEKDEASLVSNAIRFDDTSISSVMTKKFVSVTTKDSLDKIKNTFISTNYSRLPVLKSNGKIAGFIMSKDLFKSILTNGETDQKFSIKKFINPLHRIEKTANLDDALRKMQRTNTHMLGVVETRESNHLIGIITMETVIEQLVGQIYDEKDKINRIQIINNFTWVVDPDVNAARFFKKYLHINIRNKKITTETYLKKLFNFKHNKRYATYENSKFSVIIVRSQKGRALNYEITKK